MHFTCPEGCCQGKNCFEKNLIHFFGHWARNFSKFGEFFSGDLSKMQSKPAEGLLGGKDKVWQNFSVLAKTHVMSNNIDFRVSTKNNLTNYILSFPCLGRNLCRLSAKFFSAQLPNMQSMWPEIFSQQVAYFEKTTCLST